MMGTLTHEISHDLFNSPHYNTNHTAVGDKFYGSYGWSSMSYYWDQGQLVNAWERWQCGWINLPSSMDINSASQNGTYILRDYVTTGDALRIKIPHPNRDTYLWIENRQKISPADNTPINLDANGNPLQTNNPGIYMFVEDMMTPDLNHQVNGPLSITHTNGIKFMHGKGNFDYKLLGHAPYQPIWNSTLYDFQKIAPNPMGPHNNFASIRGDYPFFTSVGQGTIGYSSAAQSPQSKQNEHVNIGKIDGNLNFFQKGFEAAFVVGQKIGISHNPIIIPHQKYNPTTQRLETIRLNGISIEILNTAGNGDVSLELKYNDVDITQDQRFTGQLVLNDIPDAPIDLVIKGGKILTVDHSGTPNRQTRGALLPNGQFTYPDFVTPTYLQLNSGSSLLVEDDASLIVEPKSTLIIKSGAILTVLGKGKVDIKDGAFICIEPGAILNFTDPQSRIFVRQNATIGTNPNVSLETATTSCLDRCDIQLLLATNGSLGTIDHTYQNFTAGGEIIAYENATGYTLGSSTNPIGLYEWEPSQLLVNPTSPNPTIGNLTQNQVFTVKYTSPSGCYSYDTVYVSIVNSSVLTLSSIGNQCYKGFEFSFSGVDMTKVSSFDWDLGPSANVQFWNSTDPNSIYFSSTGTQQVLFTIQFFNGVQWIVPYELNIWYLSCCNAYTGKYSSVSGQVLDPYLGSGNNVALLTGGGQLEGSIFIDGELTLKDGTYSIIPGTELYFSGDWDNYLNVTKSKITLDNARLVIENAMLTDDCGHMWWGIDVKKGSSITMNGSILRNSYNGISVNQREGLCSYRILNNSFTNNLIASVQDNLSGDILPSGSRVENNTFLGNASTMIQPYNVTHQHLPMSFLLFSGDNGDYTNLQITQNSFTEALSGILQSGGAKNNIGNSNSFSNCYRSGVVVNGAVSISNSTFSIPPSSWPIVTYNHNAASIVHSVDFPIGIYFNNLSLASSFVSDNYFSQSSFTPLYSPQFGIFCNYPAYSWPHNMTISNNTFDQVTTGISDMGHSFYESIIEGNQFYNTAKGFELRSGNSSASFPARYKIRCNDFVKTQSTNGTPTYGMYISQGAFLNAQGGCPNPGLPPTTSPMANNEFLSDGYPLQYINNGEQSIFATNYDWYNDYWGIANFSSSSLIYTAAGNENLGPTTTVQKTNTNILYCLNVFQIPSNSNTQTCPTSYGVANRPVRLNQKSESSLSLYPNPTSGIFKISRADNIHIQTVIVFNALGELVLTQEFSVPRKDYTIDLSSANLPSGMYSIRIIDEKGSVETSSIMLIR